MNELNGKAHSLTNAFIQLSCGVKVKILGNFRALSTTCLLTLFMFPLAAWSAEIHVLASTALRPAFEKLAPVFEKESGHQIRFSWGPSTGSSYHSIPERMKSDEDVDVIVMIGELMRKEIPESQLVAESIIDFAQSRIGLAAVKSLPNLEIHSVNDLKETLKASPSIAISTGVSGIYLLDLFDELEILEEIKDKLIYVSAPKLVGDALFSGEAVIGLQQMSELVVVQGIHIVGLLPESVQRINTLSAAILVRSKNQMAAREWILYLSQTSSSNTLKMMGFEPIAH